MLMRRRVLSCWTWSKDLERFALRVSSSRNCNFGGGLCDWDRELGMAEGSARQRREKLAGASAQAKLEQVN